MPYVDGNYVSFICNLQQSPRLLKLCGGGTTKSNSNEWPISVPFSLLHLEHTSSEGIVTNYK
ncbi:hypothetical protein [Streptococcus lactarius]|uniref:hypothetical protein n=1 Tax=Streptococcus lactarius TaxID=684066 RepID=UPI001FD3C5C9|nr:hypothetical protein [Streptococcus lactarius]